MPDTKLVIVDVPGINEAESSSKYRDYITKHWNTYDCVFLVMDSRQGVNTEEQIHVLEFVKANMQGKKTKPVAILFNKVDELDIQERQMILSEAREKISSIFCSIREVDVVKAITDGNISFGHWKKSTPLFLPISARNGYIYRLAQTVDKERFRLLEKDLIEALGTEQIGLRQWNRLSPAEQYDSAYDAIREPDVYQEAMDSSNFCKLLATLRFCVGGPDTQKTLIEQQVLVAMDEFSCEDNIGLELSRWIEKYKVIHNKELAPRVQVAFWKHYRLVLNKWMRVTSDSPLASHKPIEELGLYHSLARWAGWDDEASRAIVTAKQYLGGYLKAVFSALPSGEDKVSAVLVFDDLLEMTSNPKFRKHLGRRLHVAVQVEHRKAVNCVGNPRSSFYAFEGDAVSNCKPCDTSHFCHPFWCFFQWMDSIS